MDNYIHQVGTTYYLVLDGARYRLSYEQYLVWMDVERGDIADTKEAIQARLNHYIHMHEHVPCPLCKKGTIRRDIAENQDFLESMHDSLIHRC